ncbi:hypothetical protein E2C01_066205 [Portunus trituberculatus]|uniref:Uncharacterized protein n=1 Tax=Portunus trituberculatus TaxID=210409 RepID=A0A5B7HP53_PORTR|nr:hypothetical protein [Portunus trituberculatus]
MISQQHNNTHVISLPSPPLTTRHNYLRRSAANQTNDEDKFDRQHSTSVARREEGFYITNGKNIH